MVTHSLEMLEKQMAYPGEPGEEVPQTGRSRKRSVKPEDPMSHRIIEKRRRDRMNNCLADLSRLIPADYLKKGRGRIEKTEIIEMAIKHMRHLQTIIAAPRVTGEVEKPSSPMRQPIVMEHYRLGYLECLSEAMHFLVEVQGFFAGDNLCVQMMNHLHRHCDGILKGDTLNFPRQHIGETTSNSSSSTAAVPSPPLGMSNSIGGHSDEHTEYPCCSEGEEPPYLLRNYSSSSGAESVGVKEEPEGPSQLRDMLMSHGSRKSDSGFDTAGSEEHHMYKFKNTIKQRYNESRLHDEEEELPVKKPKLEEQSLGDGRLSFGHKALIKPIPLLTTPKPLHHSKPPGVPVFALHSNSAFYIPLTLDQHLLSQHLPALAEKPPHKAVMHPITISVNFQQQCRQDVKP